MELEEFESYLTAEELNYFKENLIGTDMPVVYEAFVKSIDDAGSVITGAFNWSRSPQGHVYWSSISMRIYLAQKPLAKGIDYMQYFTAEQWKELTTLVMEHLGTKEYQAWIDSPYTNILSFISSALPTKHQQRFVQNVRVAEIDGYRMSRGFNVIPGRFMTRKTSIESAYSIVDDLI
jgi:hypothetical protein